MHLFNDPIGYSEFVGNWLARLPRNPKVQLPPLLLRLGEWAVVGGFAPSGFWLGSHRVDPLDVLGAARAFLDQRPFLEAWNHNSDGIIPVEDPHDPLTFLMALVINRAEADDFMARHRPPARGFLRRLIDPPPPWTLPPPAPKLEAIERATVAAKAAERAQRWVNSPTKADQEARAARWGASGRITTTALETVPAAESEANLEEQKVAFESWAKRIKAETGRWPPRERAKAGQACYRDWAKEKSLSLDQVEAWVKSEGFQNLRGRPPAPH
jgi:hypothetical protein